MAKPKSEPKPPKAEPKTEAKPGAKSELKSLGRYKINGVLGKGAMGLVYDGLDPTLDRRVAIKTIQTAMLDEATAKHYAMRFKREVRAVAKVNHANIVQVYDFGSEGGLNYIVMEYIQGKELKTPSTRSSASTCRRSSGSWASCSRRSTSLTRRASSIATSNPPT